MNAKAPQKPPENVEKPTELPPAAPLPNEATADYVARTGTTSTGNGGHITKEHWFGVNTDVGATDQPKLLTTLPAGWQIKQPQGFIVRVPLVCPHCSSYMRVLPSGTVMTCHSERCPNHLKKFKLPVLYAEEVKE